MTGDLVRVGTCSSRQSSSRLKGREGANGRLALIDTEGPKRNKLSRMPGSGGTMAMEGNRGE